MAKTNRSNEAREKDHKLTQAEFERNAQKVSALNLSGKSHWCEEKESQINPKVCEKFQSTAGCKTGPINKDTQTGCACWEAVLNNKATKTATKKKSSGPAKNSYQTIMSAYFFENGVAKIEDLVDAINSDPTRQEVKRPADNKNVSVGVSILRNATRTKNPLRIEYSRITKIYYFLDNKKAAAQYKKDMGQIEADKKSKAKAKKAEKKADTPKAPKSKKANTKPTKK